MRRADAVSADVVRRLCALAVAMGALAASGAQAAPRTFVASTGKDTNPCTLASPCRGFTAAIAAADPGGEVVVLDSAGYGAVTIAKSISIVAPPGVYAGISAVFGDGITVDGSAIDVALKGLAINGQGGDNGIAFTQGASLVVERCNIANFALDGVRVDASGLVVVANSAVTGNGANGMGVYGDATVAVTQSRFELNSVSGIVIQGIARATIDHTVMAGNGDSGVQVIASGAGTVDVGVDSSSMTQQGFYGVYAAAAGASTVVHVAVTRSTIAQNTNGFYANTFSGATVAAITDSDVVDNAAYGVTANGTGTTVRASANRVMRNGGFGIVASSGGALHSPANNYIRDNSTDASGQSADSLL
jgi:hypothetical protein